MEPTVLIGDRIIIKKFLETNNRKQRIFANDIIVFHPVSFKEKNKIYVKRCVGLPGDTIEIADGFLKRNGRYVDKLNNIYKSKSNIINESDFRIQHLNFTSIFPHNKEFNYSILNFGPVVVPKRGMVITRTYKNEVLYNSLISKCGSETEDKNELGLKQAYSYQITKDYYFVIGDNYFCSEDSRFWGFLHEENIIGRVNYILYSCHNGRFNWNRLLKKIE